MNEGSAILAISDLVPLLYRARWIRSSLAGEVSSRRKQAGSDEYHELTGELLAAPGGRYRADLVDEEGNRQLTIYDGRSGGIPFSELLSPSWLLAEFALEVIGETEHIGRAAYVVVGSPRQVGKGRTDRVNALVDAELGVLLRYEKNCTRQQFQTAEFISLRLDAAESADPMLFTLPTVQLPDWEPRPGDGLAAPGSAPEGMSPALRDEQINLLYRTVLGPQKFSAELHEWADRKTIMRLADAALSSTVLGSRTRWLWQSAADDHPENVDRTARLTVAMPGCYRIEALTDPGPKPACIACDGEQLWLVYPDRIAVRQAVPPAVGIALIIDPAWLLHGYRLTTDGTAIVSGRPGLQVVAMPTGEATPQIRKGPLSDTVAIADKIEVTIDVQLGIALRQVWYLEGNSVLRTELADVTLDVDPDVFRIEPPPDTRIITGGPLAETGLSPAGATWTLVKGASKLVAEMGKRWVNRRPG